MISVVVSFFLGIISLHFFSELPSLWFITVLVGLFGILLWFLKHKPFIRYIFSFSIGFLWILLHAKSVIDHRLPEAIETKPIQVVGIVDSIPETRDHTTRFDFKIQETVPNSLWPNPGRVRLRLRDSAIPIHVGDQLQLTVKLKRPHGYANPGSFDTERHLFQNRIVSEGVVVNKLAYQKLNDSILSHPIDRLRMWFRNNVKNSLKNSEFSGIVSALVVGVQSGITPSQWKILKDTGTVHLVAIAGLHVAFVTGFAMFLSLQIWRRLSARFMKVPVFLVTAVVGLGTAFFYAGLAGFSIPTQRALVMIGVFLTSVFLKREGSTWQNYFLAMGIVLLLDPLSTLAAGFWLSFGAVGLILYGMKGRLQPEGLWWKWGRIQWVLFLGLTPLMFATFGMTSLISPLANFIAIPWVGFLVLPFSFLGIIFGMVSTALGVFFLELADSLLGLLWPVLRWISELPIATFSNRTHSLLSIILAFVGVLLLLLPRGFPGKMVGLVWLLPLFLIKPDTIAANQAKITVLDVGQGLSTVVETQNHVLVFDTGPKLSADFDTGDRVVVPFLATRGRNNIDALVISHGDNDHAGGAQSILKTMPVKTIITSEPKLFAEYNTMPCYSGQHWEWDGVYFEMLHPTTVLTKKRNDHSCVLRVKAGEQAVLLTADIEAKSEYAILENNPQQLSATVMLVPHHGSRTSSTLEFIRAIHPTFAIIPVGYLNRYGHPKPDVVERYRVENIRVLDTVRQGAISFMLDGSLDIQGYRPQNKRYWHSVISHEAVN
jgi:competence protein ComEC